eukprot:132424-Hanusia_phi.AAC.1
MSPWHRLPGVTGGSRGENRHGPVHVEGPGTAARRYYGRLELSRLPGTVRCQPAGTGGYPGPLSQYYRTSHGARSDSESMARRPPVRRSGLTGSDPAV